MFGLSDPVLHRLDYWDWYFHLILQTSIETIGCRKQQDGNVSSTSTSTSTNSSVKAV